MFLLEWTVLSVYGDRSITIVIDCLDSCAGWSHSFHCLLNFWNQINFSLDLFKLFLPFTYITQNLNLSHTEIFLSDWTFPSVREIICAYLHFLRTTRKWFCRKVTSLDVSEELGWNKWLWCFFVKFKFSSLKDQNQYLSHFCVCVKRKKLCICHSSFSFFFSFSSLFLDRANVIFKVLSNCCFEPVWPGSELIIWCAVCFQPMSFRNKQ